ncbi:MAG: PAS domain-containing protein [Opitutaceae bacterium]|nr:PAS domain-containing protein [Opitutaceae bacterium]
MTTAPAATHPDRAAPLDRALVGAFLANIPDKFFFKDRASRFIAVSRSLIENFGARDADEVIGRTDFDFFTREHAQPAFEDERGIVRTGEPILDKVEKETWPDGRVTWSLTSKLPLRDASGVIVGTFGLSRDITESREMELALEKTNDELIGASRLAGMAEVATGVLHNVGNVLNSLNVSARVIAEGLRHSRTESLGQIAALLAAHSDHLGAFLATDPRGARVADLLETLSRHAIEERDRLAAEITNLQQHVDHIKEIVFLQQDYASLGGLVEPLEAAPLIEDSLRMNAGALTRHEIEVRREFQPVPRILGERGKILQILVNLIRNAKHACDDSAQPGKRITLRVAAGEGTVRLTVADNGVGIPAANLARIFAHGFTTRTGGHGFGLHSAANAAREMKGLLSVESAGPGQGASFTLELPVAA